MKPVLTTIAIRRGVLRIHCRAGVRRGLGRCDWNHGDVNINVNKFNNFTKTKITSLDWRHDPGHRKGVQYRDAASQPRYGRGQRADAVVLKRAIATDLLLAVGELLAGRRYLSPAVKRCQEPFQLRAKEEES